MAVKKYRGIEAAQELDVKQLRPETRTLLSRSKHYFATTDGVIVAMVSMPVIALMLVMVPFTGELLMLVMWMFYRVHVDPGTPNPSDKDGKPLKDKKGNPSRRFGKIRRYDFPYRVPFFAKVFDGSRPGTELGDGISFLGKEISTKLEVWTGNSDLRTHMLVLGTTGSGKTEFLLGLVYNALVQNSGFIYTDGKGDVALFNNVFRLARYLGREDDLVTINFLTSGRDFLDKQKDRTTNTMNPFALGSSGMLIELIVSLMDDSGSGGDMWKGRAISFVAGLTRALAFLRDRGYILLDANKFIEYFELPVVERMVWDRVIVENGNEIQIKDELFEKVLLPLKAFILTLPGYLREKKGAQEQKTLEQHGFITMQLTRLFGDMSFTYGYLFQTSLGEVDMYDVVINRRILVVLLPALERAPDSLKMLGKLIVGAIKQMMAGCLGNRLEGSVREIVQARPTNAAVPFYVVLDEYGYYAVLGFAVAPAQARSLGFCIIFAAQDFSSLQKASKEEADATWENTNLRAVGRMTSGKESETFRRVVGVSGEAQVQEMSRKEHATNGLTDSYRTIRDTNVTRVQRVEYDDLAQQENGEFTFLIGKKSSDGGGGVRVIRARTFYTQVKESPVDIRVNHFLKIEPPRAGSMDQDVAVIEALEAAITEMLADGKIKEAFPNDPASMIKANQSLLFKISSLMRAAKSAHRLSYGEAARVALVCIDREAEMAQATSLAAATKQTEVAQQSNVELQQSVSAVIAEELPSASEESGSLVVSLPDDDFPVVTMPDDAVISASEDGLPVSVSADATGDEDGEGDEGNGSGSGSSGGGGIILVSEPDIEAPTEELGPREREKGVPGATVQGILDNYDYTQPVAAALAVVVKPAPAEVSLLTFRALLDDDSGDPTEQSTYLEEKIAEADFLLGLTDDVLAVKSNAREAVKSMELATSYLQGGKPDPVTIEGVDATIANLLFAAEQKSTDFS